MYRVGQIGTNAPSEAGQSSCTEKDRQTDRRRFTVMEEQGQMHQEKKKDIERGTDRGRCTERQSDWDR